MEIPRKSRLPLLFSLLALTILFLSLAPACRRAVPTAAQAPSQVLTLYDAGPVTLDPAQSQEMRSHIYVLQLFSGLVALDADLQVVPNIAESWEVSRDGLIYTFKLRRGVKFHSGRE
ncbi:MAG TPA: ABC transporter substrate-binding protein, partial [Dehalococcoidia bacterium]|nr:ABC transporter substrate-binding protein [Dehalococcoidia bacterium]